jgi:glycosyltransferase involved in cell wall biosynthesis
MPQVSVIVPTRNRAQFLPLALASVLNQSFKDFEVLVVDDASDDNTPAIVHGLRDPRVRYIRHGFQRGGAGARNTGILSSQGEYVAFLDDDDEWLPEKLCKQMDLISASGSRVGCVYTGYLLVDRATGGVRGVKIPEKRGDLAKDLLINNCLGAGGSSVLLRRDCLRQTGTFDEQLPSFQDYDLWIRLSKRFEFDYVPEPLVRMYLHQKKISTDLAALAHGTDIMFRKYGSAPSMKKYLSDKYLSLAVSYCLQGELGKGRQYYMRAMAVYPFDVRHYLNFGLSFLGKDNFKRVKESSMWRSLSAASSEKKYL